MWGTLSQSTVRKTQKQENLLSREARRIAVLLSSEGLARGQAVPAMPRPGSEAATKQAGGEPMQSDVDLRLFAAHPSLPLSLALALPPSLCWIRIRSPLPKVTAHRHSRSRELCACDQCPELCQAEQPLVAHPKQISRVSWWARRVFAPGAFCTNASGGLSWHHRKAALLGNAVLVNFRIIPLRRLFFKPEI